MKVSKMRYLSIITALFFAMTSYHCYAQNPVLGRDVASSQKPVVLPFGLFQKEAVKPLRFDPNFRFASYQVPELLRSLRAFNPNLALPGTSNNRETIYSFKVHSMAGNKIKATASYAYDYAGRVTDCGTDFEFNIGR